MQDKDTILQNWNKYNTSMTEIIDNIFYLINLDSRKLKNNIVEIARNTNHQNPSEKWFYALKMISIYSVKNKEFFSQSQLYDLLTIMSRIMDERKKDIVNTITFSIYKDIMENYNKLNENLKIIFPVLIVNLMYIIKYGQDIGGNSVNLFAISSYYQNSKLAPEKELEKILSLEIE
ncbi:MAG TPA: hypothetical protein VJU85_06175, partial [Nitrososphaeraceae archaeon]|nr:hypothetical protein [Nitrososphaeraceae archaeon]